MTSRPRILAVFGNIPLYGQERGNIQALYSLQQAGCDVLLATNEEYGHINVEPHLNKLGIAWRRVPYPSRRFRKDLSPFEWIQQGIAVLRTSWRLWTVARTFEPTHIHVFNPAFFTAALPALLALNLPIVYRVGDAPSTHHWAHRLLWKRAIIPLVDQFVCISEFVRDEMLALGAAASKVRVVYNYPPERPDSSGSDEMWTDEIFSCEETVTVVYHGQLTADKGVDVLVDSALQICRSTDEVFFLIAGQVERREDFVHPLRKQIRDAGFEDRIRLLGYVDDIYGLLAQADIHVAPSRFQEALGNVVLEAKQAEVPSVVFPSGGLPELIDHEKDGYICSEPTANALTRGICHFLRLPSEKRGQAGKAARASLQRLGITKDLFTESWLQTYRDAQ
jgi:glycosyltransferase involved in cell wall biosynthesis